MQQETTDELVKIADMEMAFIDSEVEIKGEI